MAAPDHALFRNISSSSKHDIPKNAPMLKMPRVKAQEKRLLRTGFPAGTASGELAAVLGGPPAAGEHSAWGGCCSLLGGAPQGSSSGARGALEEEATSVIFWGVVGGDRGFTKKLSDEGCFKCVYFSQSCPSILVECSASKLKNIIMVESCRKSPVCSSS